MAMGQYFTEIALVAQRWDEQRVVISLERHGRFLPVMGARSGRSAVVRTVLRRCLLHLPIFNTEKTKNHEGPRRHPGMPRRSAHLAPAYNFRRFARSATSPFSVALRAFSVSSVLKMRS